MSLKRIAYLFSLALVTGLVLVHLRTAHMQAMSEMVRLEQDLCDLRQDIWQQQVIITSRVEAPPRIRELIERFQLSLISPGERQPLEEQSDS